MREMVAPSTNTSLSQLFSCIHGKRWVRRKTICRALSPLTLAACALTASPALASLDSTEQTREAASDGTSRSNLSSHNQPPPVTAPPNFAPRVETAQIQAGNDEAQSENNPAGANNSAAEPESNAAAPENSSAEAENGTTKGPTSAEAKNSAAENNEAKPEAAKPVGENTAAPADNRQAKSPDAEPPGDQGTSSDENAPLNTLILLEGVAKYGLFGRGTDLLESDQANDFDEKFSVGYFGAQATFGLMPANSAFTLAGRLRAGAYLGHSPAMGNIGAAMLFGANFARKSSGRSFSYAMGGLGVEFIPTYNADLITVHATGGTVFNEFTLGAGLDFGINNELFIATFGLQIGWGRLL